MTSSPSIRQQQKFYNDRWQDFEFANQLKLARCTAILRGLVAAQQTAPHIIDLGCGAGWLAAILGQFGPTVGVELSSHAVEQASRKFPHVSFIQADILNWDYPQQQFDVVVSQEVIEHVEQQQRYLTIAAELLRPGGYLLLTTPNPRTFNAMPASQRDTWSQQPLENWIARRELKTMVETVFDIIEFKTIVLGYGNQGVYRLINSCRVRRRLDRLGLAAAYDGLREKLGYGLHTFVMAQKQVGRQE